MDSRKIQKGDLFVAYQGIRTDGHQFISDAIRNGAAVIIGEKDIVLQSNVPYIQVGNARKSLSRIAAVYYDFPALTIPKVIGVTGSKGKTTTVHMLADIFSYAGYKVGFISTLGVFDGNDEFETDVHTTTPDALSIQRYLWLMMKNEVDIAIIETSSHALSQYRVHDCYFDTAIITNIEPEHLDYHSCLEDYVFSKTKLFDYLTKTAKIKGKTTISVLNGDDDWISVFQNFSADATVIYSQENEGDFKASSISSRAGRPVYLLSYPGGRERVYLNVFGTFNIYNSLAAISAAFSHGIAMDKILTAIANFSGITGRFVSVDVGQPYKVFIDYAHTPNSLRKLLQSAKNLQSNVSPEGKLLLLFGLSGGRDKNKRILMGKIAATYADKVVVTSVDWYPEEHASNIIEEISRGIIQTGTLIEGRNFWKIIDRLEAINYIINLADKNDIVLIVGKGHEHTLTINGNIVPWDEKAAVTNALLARLNSN